VDDLIVDGLAAARITRLVTTDTFPPAKALREAWVRKFGQGSSLADLIECGWCAGFWIAAGCRAARRLVPGWWGPVAEVFAVAMVGSYLVGKSTEEGDPKDIAEAIEETTPSAPVGGVDPESAGFPTALTRWAEERMAEERESMGRHPTMSPAGERARRKRAWTKGES
jgi:hypothetical protein